MKLFIRNSSENILVRVGGIWGKTREKIYDFRFLIYDLNRRRRCDDG